MLKVKGLTKRFGGLTAVHKLDFDVEYGETVGLIGPNGSGKTTVINMITRMITPDSGNISFKNNSLAGFGPDKICHHGVSRTFQLVKIFPEMSVLENVMVGHLYGCGKPVLTRSAREKCMEQLEFTGIIDAANLPAGSLTYVYKKRLELARALATNPDLLLLDEFMAGLTPAELKDGIALLEKVKKKGVSLIIVEHIISAVVALSDRIVALNAGEKICEGVPAEVMENETLINAYLGDKKCLM
jgi:branched-chain amino acid transport system ATP-binding protein